MADDAGSLLVRAGLIADEQLLVARQAQAGHGGTIGEHLVLAGLIDDDELTAFFRNRLLVPRVNPNDLTRIPKRCVEMIPADMAVEFRIIPVSFDREQNLTVAMGDPSNSHAVDEITFFTGAYVVRAVATQLQIAWCLAHYYGVITPLGETLLEEVSDDDDDEDQDEAQPGSVRGRNDSDHDAVEIVAEPLDRKRGETGNVEAMRHRTVAPVAAPIHTQRPTAGNIEQRAAREGGNGIVKTRARRRTEDTGPTGPVKVIIEERMREPTPPALSATAGEVEARALSAAQMDSLPSIVLTQDEAVPDPMDDGPDSQPGTDSRPILLAGRRNLGSDEPGTPREIEREPSSDFVLLDRRKRGTPDRKLRRTQLGMGIESATPRAARDTDLDVNDGDADATPTAREFGDTEVSQAPSFEDLANEGAVDSGDRGPDTEPSLPVAAQAEPPEAEREPEQTDDDSDLEPEIEISETLELTEDEGEDYPAREVTSPGSRRIDSDSLDRASASGVIDVSAVSARRKQDARNDIATGSTVDLSALEAEYRDVYDEQEDDDGYDYDEEYDDSDYVDDDQLDEDLDNELDDEMEHPAVRRAVDEAATGPIKTPVILPPEPRTEPFLYDRASVDDGWGPPGTTIPPALLGALPGALDGIGSSSDIPIPLEEEEDEVSPSGHGSIADAARAEAEARALRQRAAPEPAFEMPSGPIAVHVDLSPLEQSSTRLVETLREVDRAITRDDVVAVLLKHLNESCARVAFFVVRSGDMQLFQSRGVHRASRDAHLSLDRPSTFQDVVGTRLSFRGALEDELSRRFSLQALGGDLDTEVLIVPVAVRGRVVGLLFGDNRREVLFLEHVAAVARAAGLALEKIVARKKTDTGSRGR